jgi:hypothetical protein
MVWIIVGVFVISFFGDYIKQNFFGSKESDADKPAGYQRFSEESPSSINVDPQTLTTLGQVSADGKEHAATLGIPEKMSVKVLYCTG